MTSQAGQTPTQMDGSYYAKGEVVYRAPLRKQKADGSSSISMGFPVCEMHEAAAGQAEILAAALNSHASLTLALEEARDALKEIATMKPSEIAPETAPGLVHGPALLFGNCQRRARSALSTIKKALGE